MGGTHAGQEKQRLGIGSLIGCYHVALRDRGHEARRPPIGRQAGTLQCVRAGPALWEGAGRQVEVKAELCRGRVLGSETG